VTLTIIGVPAINDSAVVKPNPSLFAMASAINVAGNGRDFANINPSLANSGDPFSNIVSAIKSFKLSKELSNIIDEYVEEQEMEHNYKLMSFKIENRLKKVLKKEYGYDISSLDMKRMYILNILIGGTYINMKKKNKIFYMMNSNNTEANKFVYQDVAPTERFDKKYYDEILTPLFEYMEEEKSKGNIIENDYYSGYYRRKS
jgi:hypothetical protein